MCIYAKANTISPLPRLKNKKKRRATSNFKLDIFKCASQADNMTE